LGIRAPSPDSGAYCRARAKLSTDGIRHLTCHVADALETQVPADWLWYGLHVKLADGSTLMAPDTDENQAVWPQPSTQQPGLGNPILRFCVLISLATGALCGFAEGPYQGKETGEPALLRELLDRLNENDLLLLDACFCSFLMLALLMQRRVHALVHQHQRRKTDFSQGKRLGPDDHVVEWHKPACPEWMDQATYDSLPETITVRELRVQVKQRGFRPKQVTLVTTLTDAKRYSREDLGDLYRERWNVEVFHAQCVEKDNLYRGDRWAYSSRACVVEAGPLVPAAQTLRFRRRCMRSAKEGVVPPRAQSVTISACC
jgi:hypothetical protein